ncbi:MAG: DUF4351 domain-containing protein [Chromatiaceae bacterium]|nr:DUF4351 domain-containing protein [Chromatiaceae bacterium]
MSRESHDHNFKNLILDYPREAIAFFAAAEARAIDAEVRILPIREEQLKERLGERFRELDVPLLAEWPDGRRAALLFVFEEEPNPERRLKYADFIDIYAMLSETEQQAYRHRYPQEATAMMRFSERFIEQGRQEEARRLLGKQIQLKFGELPDWAEQRLTQADHAVLEDWSAAILSADSLEALLRQH